MKMKLNDIRYYTLEIEIEYIHKVGKKYHTRYHFWIDSDLRVIFDDKAITLDSYDLCCFIQLAQEYFDGNN